VQAADLDRERYLNLATFRRSGRAVETPVWFARLGEKLYAFTEARAGKVKRLRNDDRARIAPCNARGGLRGAWIPARAHVVADDAVAAAAYDALLAKYGWQMRVTNFFSRLAGRIEGRAVLEIEIEAAGAEEAR